MKLKRNRHIENKFSFLNRLIPEKRQGKIKKQLKNTDIHTETYINLSTALTTTITLIITSLLFPIFSYSALGYGAILFSILYYLTLKLPKIMERKHVHQLETSLTRSLRTIATELKIKIPFSKTIKNASESNTKAGKEFKKVMKDVEKGASYPKALANMSRRHSSKFIKRTAKQLISVHSGDPKQGSNALKKLANEQENKLKNKMEEYNQKLLFYSLIFIATSAIIPAMFQALIVVGSSFLELNITPTQALVIPSIGFPILNIGLFAYIASKKP